MKTPSANYLGELKSYLSGFASALRGRRAFADVLKVEVAQDITADAVEGQQRAMRAAYSAEQADLEAKRILETVLADRQVTAEEIPCLRNALRHVVRSANHDRRVTEVLHA